MIIKKKFQGAIPKNKILNMDSTSITDTYSCDKINKMINSSGGSSSNNFSTEEQVIGTWIDDKPLYQKTYVYTIADSVYNATIELNIENIDTIYIDAGNSYIKYGTLSFVQLGFYSSSTDFSRGWVDGDKTYIGISLGTVYTNGEKVVNVTVKYTKTTD